MTFRTTPTRCASRLCLMAAFAAGPAAADVTGPQVWADWQTYMRESGYEMTGTESQSGGALTVTDVVLTLQMSEEDGTVRMTMPRVTFTDNADGSVTVDLPPTMPITFESTPADGDAAKGTLTYAQTGPTIVVTGDPEDMTYAYDVQSVAITLDELEVDGAVVPPEDMKVAVEVTDISSLTRMQVGETRIYDQDMSAGGLTYDVAFVVAEEDGGGTGSVKGAMQDLTFKGGGELPTLDASSEMDAMLDAGMWVNGGFSYGAGSMEIDMRSPDGPVVGSTSSGGGTIEVAMGPAGLSYDVTQSDIAVDFQQLPDVPFPVSLQMAKSAFNLTTPLRAADEPQDFALGFTLGEFTVTDMIWSLFDPAGQLPRDPATISVDLTGNATILTDMMDPEATAAIGPEDAPGQIETLDINSLLVSAVGAKVTGSGGFTFDNDDTTTFNGVPRPQGSLDVRVEGANALLDTLVQMGLLPEDQAMGARMMMGLFGVPQGEDVLTSTIEINEQGHVLANGQRLQ